MEEKTILYKKESWYKPLHIEMKGKEYKLSSFIIYDNNGIITSRKYGFFIDCDEIELDFNVTRKIKVNFEKVQAYVVKCESCYDEVTYKLYIHKDLIGLSEMYYEIDKYDKRVMESYDTKFKGVKFSNSVYNPNNKLIELKKEIRGLLNDMSSHITSENLTELSTKLNELTINLKYEEEYVESYSLETFYSELKLENEKNK
ncbi:MAG: hypothetical protein RR359_04830 [Bacilli bacterium]